jgi:hypothetical protein
MMSGRGKEEVEEAEEAEPKKGQTTLDWQEEKINQVRS